MKLTKAFFYIISIIFIGLIFRTCFVDDHDLDRLSKLDEEVRLYQNLFHLTDNDGKRKSINKTDICYPTKHDCRVDEILYTTVLDDINLEEEKYLKFINEMSQIGVISYTKHEHISVWVTDGALGSLFGYLVIREGEEVPDTFMFRGFYRIGVGKKVGKNIYYFSA